MKYIPLLLQMIFYYMQISKVCWMNIIYNGMLENGKKKLKMKSFPLFNVSALWCHPHQNCEYKL